MFEKAWEIFGGPQAPRLVWDLHHTVGALFRRCIRAELLIPEGVKLKHPKAQKLKNPNALSPKALNHLMP